MLALAIIIAATVLVARPLVVQALTSLILPLVVGIVTKQVASARTKAVAMLVVNAVSALIITATVADGSAVISDTMLFNFVVGVVTSVAMYLGFWKPTGVADAVQTKTSNFGIGGA